MHQLISDFLYFPTKKPKIKYKPNRKFPSQTTFKKAKIEKFGFKKAKLATLLEIYTDVLRVLIIDQSDKSHPCFNIMSLTNPE